MQIKSLIIDDDPFMHSLLGDMLEQNFPNINVVEGIDNGKEGIEKIKYHQPDLVFLDVELTDMMGFDVLEHFKDSKIQFQTIFITSYNHFAIKALRMNALDYLTKPVRLEELQQAINSFKIRFENNKQTETIKSTLGNLEKLVLNIFPKEIADEIHENGSVKAKQYELVTVLFADIKGFSQHAERLNPEELVLELNEYYSGFDLIMENYGVEKIKTIGDAYMAVGGIPSPNTTNPADTLRAALAMQNFIKKTANLKEANHKIPFEFRIGLHSGPVVAGIVGIKKFTYDIWGDTVNIAARMEENATTQKINISQTTHDLLKDKDEFSFVSRGKIQTKGKGELEMFFVENKNQELS